MLLVPLASYGCCRMYFPKKNPNCFMTDILVLSTYLLVFCIYY